MNIFSTGQRVSRSTCTPTATWRWSWCWTSWRGWGRSSPGQAPPLSAVSLYNCTPPCRPDHRTTIEHAGFFTEAQARRLARLGCLVSAQPYYHYVLADKYSELGRAILHIAP